ncbi:DUF6157 family protein [Paenibacillus sp. y28]|uniref:DUF6157 family protein n=1 Tax=Paenibacillus sp. y28 TaxID=3129110 RepID=UPI0030170CBD
MKEEGHTGFRIRFPHRAQLPARGVSLHDGGRSTTCQTEEPEPLWSEFFSKPKACLRTSPLVKKYGWGLGFDAAGKIALLGADTEP